MFQFHSIPSLAHLRPAYRPAMATESNAPPSPTSAPTSAPTPKLPSHQPFRFLDLPLELREAVYSLYFRPADRLQQSSTLESQGFYGGVYGFEFGLLGVCRTVSREAKRVWRREVRCVKIGTPWPSAVNHISSEGLVPIVCTDARADSFNDHHALIQITAPFHQVVPEHTVVLLFDDLHLFTQTWYYSALSYPMLNDRLSTSFTLRDPDMDDIDEGDNKAIPLALQRSLLLPFSQVKGLYSIEVSGFDKAISHELRTAMAVPAPTLLESCDLATDLLHTGDALLAQGADHAAQAIHAYTAAFHAIHILIAARTRRVLADTFFHATLPSGQYAGLTGMTVRIILRLKLVARVMLAHLSLRNYGEALFWGLRSARIMGEAMDAQFERFLAELVGGDDVGLVYVRAGVALGEMLADPARWADEVRLYEGEDMADVRRLMEMGRRHFKRGMGAVRAELERWGVQRRFIALFDDASGDGYTEPVAESVGVDPTEHVGVGGISGLF